MNAELEQLIAEYNDAEKDQELRLRRIHAILKERSGFRRVQFGEGGRGGVWSNCWDLHSSQIEQLVSLRAQPITEIQQGD